MARLGWKDKLIKSISFSSIQSQKDELKVWRLTVELGSSPKTVWIQVMLNKYEKDHDNQQEHTYRGRGQCSEEVPEDKMQNVTMSSIPHFIQKPRAHVFIGAVLPVVSATHAGVQPFAVVIEVLHALVADPTVFDFRAPTLRFIIIIS